jgi:hypothetical protein
MVHLLGFGGSRPFVGTETKRPPQPLVPLGGWEATFRHPTFVIPAQAGIQHNFTPVLVNLDTGFRRYNADCY